MNMKNRAVAALMGLGMLAAPAIAQAEGLTDKLNNLQISGFVDAAYVDSNAAGTTRGITLDQVELDIEYSSGNVGLRFDLQSTGDGFAAGSFEQGYMYYNIPGDTGVTFTFGKFNAPIGWELLDAPDMYQYSHALVFDNGLMTNLVGASVSGSAADGMVDLILYVANGTDTNVANTGGTGLGTLGGRLGLSPTDGVNVGVSYVTGDNIGGVLQAQKFNMLDIDMTLELIDNLLIGAEYNQTKSWTGPGQRSYGWFVVGNYGFNDTFGATLRYGTFDFDTAVAGKSTALTGALTAALGDGLGALIEVRRDSDSTANTKSTNYVFEMTYGF